MQRDEPDLKPSNQPENLRKDPKWGTMTKDGLVIGRGENKKIVPPDEVLKLARLWCTTQEIADYFGVNHKTMKYNFEKTIQKGRSETKSNLRRAQIKLALGGNATMLIWLGKNILGQSDQPLNDINANQPLPFNDGDVDEWA